MKRIPLTQGRYCNRCKDVKPLSEFNKSKAGKDGLQPSCRSCQKEYRGKSKDKLNEYNRSYRSMHPEVYKRSSEKYKINNREKVLKVARDYARRIRKENPHEQHIKDRKQALSKRYSISSDEYNALLAYQNGGCASCGKVPSEKMKYLCIDHNHETGKVRGLLCRKCNLALSFVQDDKNILQSLIEYLNKEAQ